MIARSEGRRARTVILCAAGVLSGLASLAPAAAVADEEEESAEIRPDEPVLPEAAARVADWIAMSGDNGELPYMIIDKNTASLFLFDAEGKSLGEAPVLIGVALGDEATPGVGSKDLAEIGPAERTTPAGRFVAKFGRAVGRQQVLWIDYHTSVALHAVVTGNKKERRRERLLSPDAADNRITFGCINAPATFYTRTIRPLFQKTGGVVYVLPDSKPLEEVFPRLRVMPFLDRGVQVSRVGA